MANPLTTNTTIQICDAETGGVYTWAAQGTFGSGTLKLQYSLDGGTTKTDIASSSLTASGVVGPIYIGRAKVYANLAGATNPSINFSLDRIRH